MEKLLLTIFTPTYNRSYTLGRLFDSLQAQTKLCFKWLIIDDGSTDNTKEIVNDLSERANFEVEYVYKQNGGKHTAINLMHSMATTELVCIVDSDDYLSEYAVETILEDYKKIKLRDDVYGIIYLRSYFNGNVIGDSFDYDEEIVDPIQEIENRGYRGDKCEVWRPNLTKNFLFPEYEKERFMGETVVMIPMRFQYKVLMRNKSIYFCEYIDDGLTIAGRKMRVRNPLGGMANSRVYIRKGIKAKTQIKNTLLYIVYGLFSEFKLWEVYKSFPNKVLFLLCLLPAILIYGVWKLTL